MARKVPHSPETQFKPGESGNPAGKPKGTLSFRTRIARWLAAEMEELNPETGQTEKMALIDIIILKQVQKAKRGDSRAFELIKNHQEALPKQGIDLTSAGEKIGSKEIVFKRYKKDK